MANYVNIISPKLSAKKLKIPFLSGLSKMLKQARKVRLPQ